MLLYTIFKSFLIMHYIYFFLLPYAVNLEITDKEYYSSNEESDEFSSFIYSSSYLFLLSGFLGYYI